MSRFYFHLFERGVVTLDPDGHELQSLEDACAEALRCARSIMGHEVQEGELSLSRQINIADAERLILS